MAEQELTQEDFENLLSDAEYLLDEAEALKYVIDSVPYKENPPDGMSIYNMLMLIDHAQVSYYRPIVEKSYSENRLLKLSDYQHFTDTFSEETEENEMDIHRILNKIIKHRAALINVFKSISLIDWERELSGDRGETLILFDLANKMVKDERKILKDIADLVIVYQNEKENQREINKRASQRKTL